MHRAPIDIYNQHYEILIYAKRFHCLDCLAENLEVDTEFLFERVEEFKSEGCILFI